MPSSLPRDPDGYVDLDQLPDDDAPLDLPGREVAPALGGDTWDMIVAAAPHADPDARGIDVDELTSGVDTASGTLDEPVQDLLWGGEAAGGGEGDDGGWNDDQVSRGDAQPDSDGPDDGHEDASGADW